MKIFTKCSCLCFLFFLIAASKLHAQPNLIVSGISNPPEANGRYLPYDSEYWKHENQYYMISVNVIIQVYGEGQVYFMGRPCAGDSPVNVKTWDKTNGIGEPFVIEEGSAPVPEITVKKNEYTVPDTLSCNCSPCLMDHTQFGSLLVSSGSRSRTFSIENIGNAVLNITGVTISGTHASDFNVTTSPASTVAAAADRQLLLLPLIPRRKVIGMQLYRFGIMIPMKIRMILISRVTDLLFLKI